MSAINSKVSAASPLAHSETTPTSAVSQSSPPAVQDQLSQLQDDSCCGCLWSAISDFFYNLFCCFLCKKEELVTPDPVQPPPPAAPTIQAPNVAATVSTPVVPIAEPTEPTEICPIEPYFYFLGAADYNLKEIKNTWTDVPENVRMMLRDNAWILFLDLTSQLHSYFFGYSNEHPECQQALLLAYFMDRGDFSPLLECFVSAIPSATLEKWLERYNAGENVSEHPQFTEIQSGEHVLELDPLAYCNRRQPDLTAFYDIITEFYADLEDFLELGDQGLALGEGLAFAAGTFVKNRGENEALLFLDTLYLLLNEEQKSAFITALESRDETPVNDTQDILKPVMEKIEAIKAAEAEKAKKAAEAQQPASQLNEGASSATIEPTQDHDSSFESSSSEPIPGPDSPARRFLKNLNNKPNITREMFRQGSQLLGKIVTGNPSMTNWTTIRKNNDEG